MDRGFIYNKLGGHCGYCGKQIEMKAMQVDHMQPRSRGGTDDNENLMPSCRSCNYYKNSMTVEEFRGYMMRLSDRVIKPFIVRVAIDYGILKMVEWDELFYFEKESC